MMTDPVRWGVLGVADIAVEKVIPAIERSRYADVVAIGSRTFDKAGRAAAKFGVARAHGSYESLLADPEVEAVYIPLPNHLHEPWTIAAAEAGKHVLCEKPLAPTADAARRMIDCCDRAGVLLMEAFMYRLHPLWRRVMACVERGTIGDVSAIVTVFSYFNDDPADIRNSLTAGGGALYDIGCYGIDLARMVFDAEPTVIHAAVRRDPRFGTDVLTSVLLDFGGRHSTIVCSTQLEAAQRVEILGAKGRLVVQIPFNIPPDRPTRLEIFAGGQPPVDPHVEIVELETCDPYGAQADAFSRAVRLDETVPIDPRLAVGNLRVIEQVLAAVDSP